MALELALKETQKTAITTTGLIVPVLGLSCFKTSRARLSGLRKSATAT